MKPSKEYQETYECLFRLVTAGQAHSRGADDLRAKLDRLWGRLPGVTDEEKLAVFMPHAQALYEAEINRPRRPEGSA